LLGHDSRLPIKVLPLSRRGGLARLASILGRTMTGLVAATMNHDGPGNARGLLAIAIATCFAEIRPSSIVIPAALGQCPVCLCPTAFGGREFAQIGPSYFGIRSNLLRCARDENSALE